MLDVEVNDVFPSCPQIMHGLIVFRGTWNKVDEKYSLIPSKPVVISDLKSSRGVGEPTIIVLKSRRIVAAFRGSNMMSRN
ncbi:MAG: hypothetical protein FGF48_05300 [Candidatus Brockarchaeota archaeon]|nr:hypothetical protein [Candidatus Brockarchaeota archaeon]